MTPLLVRLPQKVDAVKIAQHAYRRRAIAEACQRAPHIHPLLARWLGNFNATIGQIPVQKQAGFNRHHIAVIGAEKIGRAHPVKVNERFNRLQIKSRQIIVIFMRHHLKRAGPKVFQQYKAFSLVSRINLRHADRAIGEMARNSAIGVGGLGQMRTL